MSDELEDLERQLRELEEKKKDLERKKNLLSQKPLEIRITRYGATNLHIETSGYNQTYVENVARKIPSRRWDAYLKKDTIEILDYTKFRYLLDQQTELKFNLHISKDVEEYIEYIINGPEVEIKLTEKDFVIRLKPGVPTYRVFGDLSSIALFNNNDHLYHVPKNEAGRLLMQCPTASWTPDAKEYAQKELEHRQKIDEVALAEDAPDFDIDLNGHKLRPFQRVGVKFGVTAGGKFLIADEMGLGKTWQAIAYAQKVNARKVAVVCPASAKENWRREIVRLAGNNVKLMYGTQPTNFDLMDLVDEGKRWFIFNYDILSRATEDVKESNGMVEKKERYLWIEAINSFGFDLVILDEAHKCKNVDAGRTKAVLKLKPANIIGLTGTPVLNRPLELWPILHLISPDTFTSYTAFENRYTDGRYGVRNAHELRTLLKPYMIRRVKKDVMKELPPIVRTTQFMELTEKQREIYNKFLNSILVDLETGEEQGVINHILVKILRLKQFLSRLKADKVADFALDTYDQSDPEDQYRKILIFSQFIPIVLRIDRMLGEESLFITGEHHKPEERQLIVDQFQTDDKIHFLVCSTHAASEALNITAAGHVVFADFMWTPASHQQAEGRAYGRLGDAHTIESHYFAVQNTLDDWLQSILRQKLDVIEETVDGVAKSRIAETSIVKELLRALKEGTI